MSGTRIYLTSVPATAYPSPVGEQTSRLRQRLLRAAEQHQGQVERVLDEHGPLIRGSFGTRARLCGNAGCHCARGEKHTSKYLTATDGGRVRQVHVPEADEAQVAAGVARYRRFRQMRKRLVELEALQLELMDELGRSLLKPYPPADPLPPASRRGRKAKDESRRR
jgi:hypothetical protein